VRRFDTISEAPEFLDHLCCPCCSGLLAHSRAAFLIADALMQNLPDQEAQTMGDSPDGLFETEPRQETPKHNLENATLDLDGGVRSLIQKAPQWNRLPLGDWWLVETPALSSSPGHTPIHEAKCFSEGKVAAAAPTSAMI
jgi:hypothetical protein